MHQRRERVEDADLHVPAAESDGVGDGVAVDLRARYRGVDEPDVDLRQARLPRDRPFGLAKSLLLDSVDQLLELLIGDGAVRTFPFLRMGGREALDEFAGDADHALRGPEARHLLGFLQRHGAVVHNRVDVRDGAGLHVRETLALATRTPNGTQAVRIDVEDQSLDELGPDIQCRAGGEVGFILAAPDLAPKRHGRSPISRSACLPPLVYPRWPRGRPLSHPDDCPFPGPSRDGRLRGHPSTTSQP